MQCNTANNINDHVQQSCSVCPSLLHLYHSSLEMLHTMLQSTILGWTNIATLKLQCDIACDALHGMLRGMSWPYMYKTYHVYVTRSQNKHYKHYFSGEGQDCKSQRTPFLSGNLARLIDTNFSPL